MPKTTPVRIRMTHDEVKAIEEVSVNLLGRINISKVVRKATRDFLNFGPDLLDLQMAEFRLAVRQLSGISNNLNQVAKAINSDQNNLSRVRIEHLNSLRISVDTLNNKLIRIITHSKQRSSGEIEY